MKLNAQKSPVQSVQWRSLIVALIAVGLMFASAYAFHYANSWLVGLVLMATSMAVFGMHWRLSANTIPPVWGANVRFVPIRINWLLLALGIFLILYTAEISGDVFKLAIRSAFSNEAQFGLIVLAMVSLGLGFSGRWRVHIELKVSRSLAILIGITLIGFILRVWRLETAVHFFVDEMNFGLGVVHLSQFTNVPLYAPFSNVTAFPWFYPFWQSWTVGVFGHTLTGLRAVSVVFGVATIPAIYFLTIQLFEDKRLALLSAFLLAIYPPHIHFSRLGINNVVDPLIGILMLTFLTRGLKRGGQGDFILAGIMLGLTQYFYEGGRILYPVLLLFWVEVVALLRRVNMQAETVKRMGLMLLTGLLIALPIYYTLIALDKPLLQRFGTAGIGGSYYEVLRDYHVEQTLEEHLTRPFLLYVREPELSQFYGGETPLLILVALPFFLTGLGCAIWRWREPGMILALFWFIATLAGNAFLADSSHAARYVVSFPAVVILSAIGIRFITGSRRLLIVLIALGLAVVQVDYYFGLHLKDYNRQLRPFYDSQDAIFRSIEFPPSTQVCFITDSPRDEPFLLEMRDYVAPQIDLCFISIADLTADKLETLPQDAPLAIYVEPDDAQTLSLLQESLTLDGPFVSPYETVPEKNQFALYYTPELR